MTNPEDLLIAAEELIGQIEDAKTTVQDDIAAIANYFGDIDGAVDNLAFEARQLARLVDEARKAAPHLHDPVAAATVAAIDNLLKLLTEAKSYFTDGNNLAAYGTLVMFDDHAEDLRAAFRLCQMRQRRAS